MKHGDHVGGGRKGRGIDRKLERPGWFKDDRERDGVQIKFDGYWLWILTAEPAPYETTGKYLFFSENPMKLVRIACDEITQHGFHTAKVNAEVLGGTEHVLCLYFQDDSRKYELRDRNSALYQAKYRWWKSNADTRAGRYSAGFLESLRPGLRDVFNGEQRIRE